MPRLVRFLVSFVLINMLTTMSCMCADSSDLPTCPVWTYPSPSGSECVCGDSLYNAVICNQETLAIQLIVKFFCFILNDDNGVNTTLLGTCPYGVLQRKPRTFSVSQIYEDSRLCSFYNRKGQLCGECAENYTLPGYSYYLGCVKCNNYNNGWIKFIVAAFLPLTIFYIIVIIFRISVTSSTLNAFVMVSQIAASPPVIRNVYSRNLVKDHHHDFSQFILKLIIAIGTIWNLDFFRSWYGYICIHPDLNYQQILLLEYAIAIYPLFLILLTFILVKLHDNFAFVVWIWKPFHRCLAVFRRQWNIRSYLVHAFATFIVLSYVKILNTSFELLRPSLLYDMHGHHILKAYWYYDGRVDMTSKGYIPILVLALFMLLFFNVFPLVLLALYPFKCFQRLLNFCLSQKTRLVLQIYMDSFHGCYEDTAHDYRHFATLYLAVRFLNLLMASIFNYTHYLPAAALVFVFALALVAKFQPYKSKRNNTVDIILLLAFITVFISSTMHYAEEFMYTNLTNDLIITISVLIVLGYQVFLILASVFPKATQCYKKCKTLLLTKIKMSEVNEEDRPLLNEY